MIKNIISGVMTDITSNEVTALTERVKLAYASESAKLARIGQSRSKWSAVTASAVDKAGHQVAKRDLVTTAKFEGALHPALRLNVTCDELTKLAKKRLIDEDSITFDLMPKTVREWLRQKLDSIRGKASDDETTDTDTDTDTE